jgi:uncharacterized protein YbcC (UPF0753/DUF2309 family)
MIDKIKCPNCGHDFDVEDALSGKLEAHFKAEYEKNVASQAEKFKAKRLVLDKDIEEFEKKKEKENELFKEKLEQQLVKKTEKIQKETKEDFEQQLKYLKEENDKKKEENRLLKSQEIDLLKRENELNEKAEDLKLNV